MLSSKGYGGFSESSALSTSGMFTISASVVEYLFRLFTIPNLYKSLCYHLIMCGITGFIDREGNLQSDSKRLLETMTAAIEHRGPDDSAFYLDENCGLGMSRLAIQDLTPGLYPFVSRDGNRQLIFNGEIYNFPELKKELEGLGYNFKSNCDAEGILHGYEEWGVDVLNKLRGMFAIALWDKKEEKLFLARDRIGIKPLYYMNTPAAFYFSSEAKSLYRITAPTLDLARVSTLLGYMYLPDSESSIVNNVKKLLPATYAFVSKNSFEMKSYWKLDAVTETKISFADAVDKLDELLNEAVKQHLLSDVPLGVLLSGGLDSSLLTAIITKNKLQNSINTYTAKFDHKFNESDNAFRVAEELGTNHTEVTIDTADLNKNLEKYTHILDDLTTLDGGIFSMQILTKKIKKEGTTVLLLGEGADEIFGGYSWFGLSQLPFSLLPKIVRSSLYYYANSRNVSKNTFKYITYENKLHTKQGDVFRDITLREVESQLPNHLLMKVDKGSMQSSTEARVPYLDHKVLEFVYSLPREYKLKGDTFNFSAANEKLILREVAKRYLPTEVVTRKKRGFFLPIDDVVQQDITKVRDYALSSGAIAVQLLGKPFVEQLFEKSNHKVFQMQKEYFLWRIFLLEVWAKHYKIRI